MGINETLMILARYSGSGREKLELSLVRSSRARAVGAIERAEFEYPNTRLKQAREPNEFFFLIIYIGKNFKN